MEKITVLPLLLTLLCTVAFNTGAFAGTEANENLKARFQNSKLAVCQYNTLIICAADTIPESELSKIKKEDIESVSVVQDIITVRLKNGDSVIAKKESNVKTKSTLSGSEQIFVKVEEEATFPGGPSGWLRYLNRTFRYPKEAEYSRIQGTVLVQFMVDKQGNVGNVQAIDGPARGGLREEAVRVIKKSGKWIPGKQNGQVVTSYKRQPLTFKLDPH